MLSETATIVNPCAAMSCAAIDPALPNPWMATVELLGSIPSRLHASSATNITPRPVAALRPWLPPTESGLPVTTAGTEKPCSIEIVSMIQAMIFGEVLTSGAGMSYSGPMITLISVA